MNLLGDGSTLRALLNIGLNLFLCLGGVALGKLAANAIL
jgi:hypothetical protein